MNPHDHPESRGDDPIVATGLTKSYEGRVVLNNVDLRVRAGEVVGLLGPNGAGKTTAVKAMLGMVHLAAGSVKVLGYPAANPLARARLGYLPEQFRYPEWLSGTQVLETHARLMRLEIAKGDQAIEDALRLVGLAGRGGDRVASYSKGMQQRLGLATAVLGRPDLVILDEPTSALDPIGRREVRDLIRELRQRGTAVLLNSHLLGEVEQVCDQVVILNKGQVLHQGQLADVDPGVEVRVTIDRMTDEAFALIEGFGRVVARDGDTALVALDERAAVSSLNASLVGRGWDVLALVPMQRSLEDVFVDLIGKTDDYMEGT